jgi:hypothetical protein
MRTVTSRKEILPTAVLKAVIIYDDFDAAARATLLLERVARRAGEGIKWDIKPWRCDVLKQPTLAALTIAVAANADIIVLTVQRTQAPPTGLLDWLNNWAKHRRIEDAAVLLLHTDTAGHLSKAWDEIQALVAGRNLTYLGSHKVPTTGSPAPSAPRFQPRRQLAVPPHGPSRDEQLTVSPHSGIDE